MADALSRQLEKSFQTVDNNFRNVAMRLDAINHALAIILTNLDAVAELDSDHISRGVQADPRTIDPSRRGEYQRLVTSIVRDIVRRARSQRHPPETDEGAPSPDEG